MTEPTEPKFCKDCKHYESEKALYYTGTSPAKCVHPNNMGWHLERGHQYPREAPWEMRHGSLLRLASGESARCGEDAVLFEARPPAPEPDPVCAAYENAAPRAFPAKEPAPSRDLADLAAEVVKRRRLADRQERAAAFKRNWAQRLGRFLGL